MKKIFTILTLSATLAWGCEYVELPGRDERDYSGGDASLLTLADPNATLETRALYSNLWAIKEEGFMFGHHDDLWCGRYWLGTEGKSDTKDVCGDYPAVLGVDFAELVDDRHASDPTTNNYKLRSVKQAYDMGMVTIVCLHLDNPLTYNSAGADHNKVGGAWDNTDKTVVKQILTDGSAVQTTYKEWMDRLADIVKGLKGTDGKTIPIILRPYHEHNHTWSWWGSQCTTDQEFKDLWQSHVPEFITRDRNHPCVIAWSLGNELQSYYDQWPGDEWVDFLGMDCYQGINNAVFTSNLKTLSRISASKKKPCGVTETGVEGFTKATYWTENIHAPMTGRKVSLLVTWRNKYVGTDESDKHYFSVYPGHPSAADFVSMYRQKNTFFRSDLPDMYKMAENITVK